MVALVPGQPEYRILIVEDQLENQLLLARLMKAIGLSVKIAENGEQGVALFQQWQPHLIWMDRRMPIMDGMEASRIIRQLPGGDQVKIIAVTASAFLEQREEMLVSGMDDFLRKPYRDREIYAYLNKHLGLEFVYEHPVSGQKVNHAEKLTVQMINNLPDELCQELMMALESLESERIERVIDQVAVYDQALQSVLFQLASEFDYPAMIKTLAARRQE